MRDIVIAPQSEGKGRSFQAICLAIVEADSLWPGGDIKTDTIRPVWAMFAGSDQEMRPFAANLQLGRKANFPTQGSGYRQYQRKPAKTLELLRSAGYQLTWQREKEGSIVTAFLPDLFRLDPGMVDVKGATFIVLPTKKWLMEQKIDALPIVKHAQRFSYNIDEATLLMMVPTAFLFCSYLDRRTRCPLVSDGRFYLQLMLACMAQGLASWSNANSHSHSREFGRSMLFYEEGTEDVGLLPGIAFNASHDTIEAVLAEQVALFFKATRGKSA